MTDPAPKLINCPFCGSDRIDHSTVPRAGHVTCENCGAAGPSAFVSIDDPIVAWNTRATGRVYENDASSVLMHISREILRHVEGGNPVRGAEMVSLYTRLKAMFPEADAELERLYPTKDTARATGDDR